MVKLVNPLFSLILALALALSNVPFQGVLASLSPDQHHHAAAEGTNVLQSFLTYNTTLESSIRPLNELSESQFTSFSHPLFPRYSVRVKKSKFCDATVNSYTGYVDFQGRHMFFYFFESRRDPDADDVILWTNGGPGCSSSLGLFMELGPCRILDEHGPKFHPESWNSNANVFFIDQPVGAGFSYFDFEHTIATSEEAARDIAAFIVIFFENFPEFKGRAFHMAGESYGGHVLPNFASHVYDQNARLLQEEVTPINLVSVMMGDGLTDVLTMTTSYYDMQCTPTSIAPINDVQTCVRLKQLRRRCQKWIPQACVEHFDAMECSTVINQCGFPFAEALNAVNKNPWDISKDCYDDPTGDSCYPEIKHHIEYLNRPNVRQAIGVDPTFTANFSLCNEDVLDAFHASLDSLHSTQDYVAALLERGVRVLVYVGTYDWLCNWIGNERWTKEMKWSGQKDFVDQELRDWFVDGRRSGITRSARGLTFATVEGAGHMVPYDKPKEALELMKRWLRDDKL
ncbi:hypothetical protein HGRIS_002049 [Hohenbuehelia grisea]|uniref:Carboxypeptidase n=1 Tax=Hohenbuehelia grisea TaxID=104357 RepID=A0ABR3JKG4_9AGAR